MATRAGARFATLAAWAAALPRGSAVRDTFDIRNVLAESLQTEEDSWQNVTTGTDPPHVAVYQDMGPPIQEISRTPPQSFNLATVCPKLEQGYTCEGGEYTTEIFPDVGTGIDFLCGEHCQDNGADHCVMLKAANTVCHSYKGGKLRYDKDVKHAFGAKCSKQAPDQLERARAQHGDKKATSHEDKPKEAAKRRHSSSDQTSSPTSPKSDGINRKMGKTSVELKGKMGATVGLREEVRQGSAAIFVTFAGGLHQGDTIEITHGKFKSHTSEINAVRRSHGGGLVILREAVKEDFPEGSIVNVLKRAQAKKKHASLPELPETDHAELLNSDSHAELLRSASREEFDEHSATYQRVPPSFRAQVLEDLQKDRLYADVQTHDQSKQTHDQSKLASKNKADAVPAALPKGPMIVIHDYEPEGKEKEVQISLKQGDIVPVAQLWDDWALVSRFVKVKGELKERQGWFPFSYLAPLKAKSFLQLDGESEDQIDSV